MRWHAQMLADAGVDTLIFDTSNKVICEHYCTALFETLTEVRAEGNDRRRRGMSTSTVRGECRTAWSMAAGHRHSRG